MGRYSWNFQVYHGKDTSFSVTDPAVSHLTKSEVVVVNLMRDLLDKGCHVVTDNWNTSYCLNNYLLTRETLLTGVVCADQGPPKRLIAERLEIPGYICLQEQHSGCKI